MKTAITGSAPRPFSLQIKTLQFMFSAWGPKFPVLDASEVSRQEKYLHNLLSASAIHHRQLREDYYHSIHATHLFLEKNIGVGFLLGKVI